ncbi:MAG: hypothetical protein OXN89_10010, partial [Bryobacterales bacterium]|nr:hypothetical protein [Bryobacterales bacterium]
HSLARLRATTTARSNVYVTTAFSFPLEQLGRTPGREGTRRLSPPAGGDRRDTQGLAARRPLPTVDSGCRGRRGLVRIALGKSSSASRGDSGGTALAKTRQQPGT